MSSSQKTISINPALFNMPKEQLSKPTKRAKKGNAKGADTFRSTTLKNKFIEKIKQHQKKEHAADTSRTNGPRSEFEESLRYLNALIEKENNSRELPKSAHIDVDSQLNKMETFQTDNFLREQVNIDLPMDLKQPETIFSRESLPPIINDSSSVPYGCLRNGTKPTYREWARTKKRNTSVKPLNVNETLFAATTEYNTSDRENKLNRVKSMFRRTKENGIDCDSDHAPIGSEVNNVIPLTSFVDSDPTYNAGKKSGKSYSDPENTPIEPTKPATQGMAIKRKITRKYICGKNPKTRKVSVLIKNGEGRASIINEKRNLSRRSLSDMKTYLHKNGLLKIGSTAPKNIISDMYEACILTGKVSNTNDKIHIHNFVNSK